MKKLDAYLEKKKTERPIDKLTAKTYSWWGRTWVFIMNKKIKTWYGVFILAFITGIVIATFWFVSFEGR